MLRNVFEDMPGEPFDEEKTREVMRFDVIDDASDPSSLPAEFPPSEFFPEEDSVRTRDWVFERNGGFWTMNDKIFNENRSTRVPGSRPPRSGGSSIRVEAGFTPSTPTSWSSEC